MHVPLRRFVFLTAVISLLALSFPLRGAGPTADQQRGDRAPNFDRMAQDQAETDKTWRDASAGYMQMEKITYRSRVGDLDIPAFVFQPLKLPTAKGYIVIAPEYRGSVGYGQAFYEAIDYGGNEVDDVVTAVDVLRTKYSQVDPSRIGIIGWSHGGMITLLSILRNQTTFRAAVALVPVTNLFQRLAWKGVERQHQAIDPTNRYGGLPSERHDVYRDRSPLYNIDKLQIPLYVGVTRNDEDVNIEEDMQLVDALRARKPSLAETMVYDNP